MEGLFTMLDRCATLANHREAEGLEKQEFYLAQVHSLSLNLPTPPLQKVLGFAQDSPRRRMDVDAQSNVHGNEINAMPSGPEISADSESIFHRCISMLCKQDPTKPPLFLQQAFENTGHRALQKVQRRAWFYRPRQQTMRVLAILTALVALSSVAANSASDCGDPTTCHKDALCVADNTCECAPGYRDVSGSEPAGTDCDGTGFAVRYITTGTINPAALTLQGAIDAGHCMSGTKGFYMQSADTPDGLNNTGEFTVVNCIYETENIANNALDSYSAFSPRGVHRWVLGTTSAPIQVPPTGLTLDTVTFSPSCAVSGCWVLTGTLTMGHNVHENTAFNTFYLPSTNTSDALSYDYNYAAGGSSGDVSVPVEWTFSPVNHPCTSAGFDPSGGITQKVITCCISATTVGPTGGFLANYRTTEAFETWGNTLIICSGGNGEVLSGTYKAPADPLSFLQSGKFVGMPNSPGVTALTLTDPFFGQFDFTIQLDEVELRTMAGQLRGTVGVEHTIDTFLGLTNFRITGIEALDPFSTQVAIHLEKTRFFTVSTQGTNDYTFLEYVNLRLVTIYKEDADFSGTAESGDTTVRTNSTAAADYIQVTFTLGSQYDVNANYGLIPLSSVRASQGTFFDSTPLEHKCTEYTDDSFTDKATFELRRLQSCAPTANMCVSPSSIPDSFVLFNIPLGIDYYPEPSDTLSNNIFVDMVISAVDEDASGTPANDGDALGQMKTTLTASIPVVEGGVNVFCDGYTAKTDLKDVANADIVVGSASSWDELTRLRIKANVASTQLSPDSITQIDSDSIEAGLMTLVIKGEASYFESNTGRDLVTVELEDVITIHIMEDDGDGSDTDVSASVMALITAAPDDNSFSQGIDTDGYALNGAFEFTIDRAAQRAHLEPTDGLLALCPFNPPRPAGGMPLETCVTRRDVRYRGYPARAGAYSTAMEICAGDGTCSTEITSAEAQFMVSIFGDNTFAKNLAVAYSGVISTAYKLNGRYRRAYWINPGYEWTPTQTGGTPIFSVSQKLYMFALITLDEALTNDDGATGATLNLPTLSRRRMLLQSTPDQALQDGESSLNAEALEFWTTPRSMMAKAFEVPEDRVATFKVTLQLTEAEACMTPTELQTSIRATLDDYLSGSASATRTVQVTAMSVDKAGVQCRRRSLRALLSSFSDATAEVTMMVVFEKGTAATISLEKLKEMAGVNAVEPLVVSDKVDTAPVDTLSTTPSPTTSSTSIASSPTTSSSFATPSPTTSSTSITSSPTTSSTFTTSSSAPTASSAPPAPIPSSSDDSPDSWSNVGLIAGAAAGAAVAVFAVTAIAIAAAVMFFRRRKSSSHSEVICELQI